jgi:3-oxoacyl-[acyl-carrier-protein] synthase II
MALDPAGARPFDRDRKGLTVGEGGACVLLMDSERARREGRPAETEVAGWGLSNDANHMTGPSRDGRGLALAVRKALASARLEPAQVGSIHAHGTGTSYNDSMELKAFRQVFGAPVPTYSIKGGTGHTMGAAGLVELLVTAHSLRAGLTPPTVGLADVDEEARGWASPEAVPDPRLRVALSTNSGFGGVNCALLLQRRDS